MHSDLDQSVTSSSEQSFDTVIFQDQTSKAANNSQLNSNCNVNCVLLDNFHNSNELVVKNNKAELFLDNTCAEHCNSRCKYQSNKLRINNQTAQIKRNNKEAVWMKMLRQSRNKLTINDNMNEQKNHYSTEQSSLHARRKIESKKNLKRNLCKKQHRFKWHPNRRKAFFLPNECEWSEELWVDGPKAFSKKNRDQKNNNNNVNFKKQRIEQWIAARYSLIPGNAFINNEKLNKIFDLVNNL